jgi:6-phosphogluconate dehydrogenase
MTLNLLIDLDGARMTQQADIGVIGLAVMGQNLVLNMNDHGYTVAVFNRTVEKVDEFLANEAAGTQVIGTRSIEEFVAALKPPRRMLLMVKAGQAVDATIEQLVPHLDRGDIIIDGGNSHYEDSARRVEELEASGLRFVGAGVSGGEEGARHGPSIMPGGSSDAWPHIQPILQAIAAKVADGTPCCDWIGPGGSGHYVKMVHNGIEYGDIQLICETYHLMKSLLGMSADEMSAVFGQWNEGELDSYLIEITRDILAFKDEDGQPMIDKILDVAGQKGTGKWTAVSALDEGIPLTLIGEAVFARGLSALKEERVAASKVLDGPSPNFTGEKAAFVDDLGSALYAAKIVSYTQGYMLLRAASDTYGWGLDYGSIALMWREGCIIRSAFLEKIKAAFDSEPNLTNLLLDAYFHKQIDAAQPGWRRVVAQAALQGIPAPAITSGLAFYDGYRTERLPANLLQAQRDYFGAHTYERVDRPRGEYYHTNWTGRGGSITSSSYQA